MTLKQLRFGSRKLLGGRMRRFDWYLCDCGKEVERLCESVRRGATQSCGCAHITAGTIHGLSKHPLRATYTNMIDRCTNPKNKKWKNYGGRGIEVCAEWLRDYVSFIEYVSKLPFYDTGRTLDRIQNSGNYEPGNVRWATASEQAFNRDKLNDSHRFTWPY